jgi:mono/diheme cytochrome c family protein
MKFLLGLILGAILVPVAVFCYFQWGHVPVATDDPGFPMEKEIVHRPLGARIDREAPKSAPMEASDANLVLGAQIYREQCAACHGLYGRPSSFAAHMYPQTPQLWDPHRPGVVGVSDDPPGETYWKVKNGIRLSGMPSFDKVLNDVQMWQVTLLVAHADKPTPAVLELLKQPLIAEPVPPGAPSTISLPAPGAR